MVEPHPAGPIPIQRPSDPPGTTPIDIPEAAIDWTGWIGDLTFAAMDDALPIVREDVTAHEFRDVMFKVVGHVIAAYQEQYEPPAREAS